MRVLSGCATTRTLLTPGSLTPGYSRFYPRQFLASQVLGSVGTDGTGLMGLGIADVVVLDKDDDYLPLHEELGDESQRYNLARGCPINLFDIPYGPQDVDPQDPQDLFSEFLANSLMTALS